MFNDILEIQKRYEKYLEDKAEYSELNNRYHASAIPKDIQWKMHKLNDSIMAFNGIAVKYIPILLSWIANHR